mgnify:CR=1 FL=1|tara:strand:- start:1842 stop:2600 length:759 start_codon:yes stop_codon:yes gene_type:complete
MKMSIPTTAIIDADIIAYKAACYVDIEGYDEMEGRIKDDLKRWTPKETDSIVLTFSCKRKDNFRRQVWEGYKKKRDASVHPDSLSDCREYMSDNWETITEPSLEADDIMGIYVSRGEMLGVTIDKDLKTIPGYHWNPDKDKDIRYISEEEADRFFHLQWMTGDSTDSIPGLWRIGPKKATKLLDEWDVDTWDEEILEMYSKCSKVIELEVDPREFALSMARSVRILRDTEYDFNTQEVSLWLPIVGYNNDKE